MPVRYTPEQREWMERHYAATPNRVLAEQFSERFGEPVTKGALNSYGTKHGLRKAPGVRCSGNRRYTDEQLDFLREFVPGHTEREIIAAFAERFGVTLNRSKVKNLKTKLGVRSGVNSGCFKKGLVPANKGKTWDEFLSPEAQERSRKTTFKKGNRPHNAYRKLLDEKTDARGTWVYVKPRKRRYSADEED